MSKSEIKRKCVTNPLEMAKEIERLKKLVESAYREGCEDTLNELSSSLLPGAVRYSHEYKWHKSETKKRLEE